DPRLSPRVWKDGPGPRRCFRLFRVRSRRSRQLATMVMLARSHDRTLDANLRLSLLIEPVPQASSLRALAKRTQSDTTSIAVSTCEVGGSEGAMRMLRFC